MKQIWKPVEGYESFYLISSWGRVKSLRRKRNLAIRFHHRYAYTSAAVVLHKDSVGKETQVSRLVAQAFVPNPTNKPFVNHIDNDATNNRVENLEWVTREENVAHAVKHKRFAHCGRKKLIK